METILHFNQEHKILICIPCGHGILYSGVVDHLRKKHASDMDSSKVQQIYKSVQQYQTQLPETRDEVVIPSEPVPQIPHLLVYRDALGCNACPQLFIGDSAKKNLLRHIQQSHGANTPGTETPSPRPMQAWRHVAACQKYYHSMGRTDRADCVACKLFEVIGEPSASANSEAETHEATAAQAEFDRLFAERENKRRVALQQVAQTLPPEARSQVNPFLQETGFQRIFTNMDIPYLVSLYTKPTAKQEPELHLLWMAVRNMLKTCQYTVANETSNAILTMVMNEETGLPAKPRLRVYQDSSTKHGIHIQYLFMYFARTYNTEEGCRRRPAYTFTEEQDVAWGAISNYLKSCDVSAVELIMEDRLAYDREDGILEPLEALCHRFLLALIKQEFRQQERELAVYIAIGVVFLNASGYHNTSTCSTILSAIKKMSRFAFIQELANRFRDNDDDDDDDAAAPTPVQVITEWTHLYLSTKGATIMQWIIDISQFAKSVVRNEMLDGFVSWEGSTIRVREISLNMSEFKNMVHSLYQETMDQLLTIAFAQDIEELPEIPWSELQDQPCRQDTGWHVFEMQGNRALAHGRGFVKKQARRALGEKRWQRTARFWEAGCLAAYQKQVREFLMLLMLLIHLTYGQLARGTELLSTYFCNDVGNGLRNLFLVDGLIAIISRYSKLYHRSRTPKVVNRFLPRAVGSLLGWYLWLVLPYLQSIESVNLESGTAATALSFSPLLWPGPDGKPYSDSRVLSEKLGWATRRWLGTTITARVLRHMVIGIGRRIMGKGAVVDMLTKEELLDLAEGEDRRALEEQSGHSQFIGEMVYARMVDQLFAGPQKTLKEHYRVSTMWHDFLGFKPITTQRAPEPGGQLLGKRRREGESWAIADPVASAMTEARMERELARSAIDARVLLRDHFGAAATYRGKQEDVIRAILDGESPVLYIAGTGSGKSMSFMLPALAPGFGLSIVIVPMVALRQNVGPRLAAMSIRHAEWDARNQREDVDILLAMAEHVSHQAFKEFVQRTRQSGRLARIVIDECHYVLTTDDAFRPDFRSIRQIVAHEAPLTLLTATLPPTEERSLWADLGLLDAPHKIFREPTTRKNIRYEVQRLRPSELGSRGLVRYLEREMDASPHEKMLAYINDKQLANEIGDQLACGVYHSDIEEERREQILGQFAAASAGILIATSGLSLGFHEESVRKVFSFGTPKDLRDYAQESGRAGRDGKPALARVILAPGLPSWNRRSSEVAKQWVTQFTHGRGGREECRRKALDLYLDGRDRTVCRVEGDEKEKEEACDVCWRRMEMAREALATPSTTTEATSAEAADDPFDISLEEEEEMMQRLEASSSMDGLTPARSLPGQIAGVTPLAVPRKQTAWSPPPPFQLASRVEAMAPSQATRRPMPAPWTPARTIPSGTARSSTMTMDGSPTLATSSTTRTWSSMPYTPTPSSRTWQQARERRIAAEAERKRERVKRDYVEKDVAACIDFWARHCILCLHLGHPWNHHKDSCGQSYSVLASTMRYKINLKGKWGVCMRCLLGPGFCDRFASLPGADAGGIRARNVYNKGTESECKHGREIIDVWAVIWSSMEEPRQMLLNRMADMKAPTNMDSPAWGEWYSEVIKLECGYKISRILCEVVWITQNYFIGLAS